MPYCTRDDMISRYGQEELVQLTDRSRIGAVDDTELSAKIADAGAEIDGYVGTRYTLPLSPVPLALVRVACSIAWFHLHRFERPDYVKDEYKNAVRFLEAVSAGKVSLGADAAGAQPAAASGADMEGGGRVFGRSDTGFI